MASSTGRSGMRTRCAMSAPTRSSRRRGGSRWWKTPSRPKGRGTRWRAIRSSATPTPRNGHASLPSSTGPSRSSSRPLMSWRRRPRRRCGRRSVPRRDRCRPVDGREPVPRACLLTGRNHHVNGMGRVIELATGFPGYDAVIPTTNGFLSEMLVPHGYAAYAVGKWHLTPEDECHAAAPRHRWPLARGFERFYGFFSGETHQFVPALVSDNHQVQPGSTPEEGYHLTEDLVDHAMGFVGDLRAADPAKPFFLYFCTGACHAPHQAPAEWIEPYRGRFDSGWDAWRDATLARQIEAGVLPQGTELSPRPDWVPAWDSLSASE